MLFVWRESRTVQPMLPLSLFSHRLFTLTTIVGLLVNIAIYGLIFVLSLYFQRINGLSAWWTGLAFVPMMGAVLPLNLLAPRLADAVLVGNAFFDAAISASTWQPRFGDGAAAERHRSGLQVRGAGPVAD